MMGTLRETEIRSALDNTGRETLADALAVLLAQGSTPHEAVAGSSRPELTNFAQAILYLKKNYDFEELELFSTEADLVYVQTADRKILLSDRMQSSSLIDTAFGTKKTPGTAIQEDESEVPPKSGQDRGRFSNLEI
jgi:hypothetical protein